MRRKSSTTRVAASSRARDGCAALATNSARSRSSTRRALSRSAAARWMTSLTSSSWMSTGGVLISSGLMSTRYHQTAAPVVLASRRSRPLAVIVVRAHGVVGRASRTSKRLSWTTAPTNHEHAMPGGRGGVNERWQLHGRWTTSVLEACCCTEALTRRESQSTRRGNDISPKRRSRSMHLLIVASTSPSSRGPGRGPFKAKTRVRIPLGTPAKVERPDQTGDELPGRLVPRKPYCFPSGVNWIGPSSTSRSACRLSATFVSSARQPSTCASTFRSTALRSTVICADRFGRGDGREHALAFRLPLLATSPRVARLPRRPRSPSVRFAIFWSSARRSARRRVHIRGDRRRSERLEDRSMRALTTAGRRDVRELSLHGVIHSVDGQDERVVADRCAALGVRETAIEECSLLAVTATHHRQRSAARRAPRETAQQIFRVDVATDDRSTALHGCEVSSDAAESRVCRVPRLLGHDPQFGPVEVQPLRFGARRDGRFPFRVALPGFVPHHFAAIERPVQDFVDRRRTPAGRPRVAADAARAPVRCSTVSRCACSRCPAAQSAKIRRTTSACASLMRRSTWPSTFRLS